MTLNRVYEQDFLDEFHRDRHLMLTFNRKRYRAFADPHNTVLTLTNGRRSPSRDRYLNVQDKHPWSRFDQLHNITVKSPPATGLDKAGILSEMEELWALIYPQVVGTEHECRLWNRRGEIQEACGDANSQRSYIAAIESGYGGETANNLDVDSDGPDGYDGDAMEAAWHLWRAGVSIGEALA